MKRFFNISALAIALGALLLSVGCEPHPLPAGSFVVNSGIVGNRLELEGAEGASTRFAITSAFAWEVAPCEGVHFEPSSGEAGENITITATALQANNSLDEVRLGEVTFIVESTRFVGIEAFQLPQIELESDAERTIWVGAAAGESNTFDITCSSLDIEAVATGDVECKTTNLDAIRKRFRVSVAATADNRTMKDALVGQIGFEVNGVRQAGTIEVRQYKAIRTTEQHIKVNGLRGSTYTLTVETPFEFNAISTSKALSLDCSGADVTITALAENTGEEEVKIGDVVIALKEDDRCSVALEVWQCPAKAPTTLMVYMLGTALKSYFKSNVNMILKAVEADILGESRIVIFTQSTTQTGAIYEPQYDTRTGKATLHEICTVDLPVRYNGEMMADILSKMAKAAPAHNYSLLFGSHAKGWLPKDTSASMLRAGRNRIERIWTPLPGMPDVRHVGDSSTTQIDTDEFAEAIAAAGLKFEFILFDCCYMSSVEALYDMRATARYILASPCEVMAAGFPYDEILPLLVGQQYDLDGAARSFVDFYLSGNAISRASACAAVTDCEQLESLAEAMKRVNNAPQKPYSAADIQPYDGVHVTNNPTHIFFDLEDFVLRSCADEQAASAFVEQLSKTVTSRYHTPTFFSVYNGMDNPINYYSGITTSAPIESNDSSAYIDEWRETAWYKATH